MNITVDVKLDLKTKEIKEKVEQASRLGLRDTIVVIWADSIKNASRVFWKTGHNARSLVAEVSELGIVEQGADAEPEKSVDDTKLESALYSTSGYGGFGETGTWKMSARPYIRPALDAHKDELIPNIKKHLET